MGFASLPSCRKSSRSIYNSPDIPLDRCSVCQPGISDLGG
jgi:hypothetical protein